MQKVLKTDRLFVKCVFKGLPLIQTLIFLLLFKSESFHIRHVTFRVGTARIHNVFFQLITATPKTSYGGTEWRDTIVVIIMIIMIITKKNNIRV